MIELNKLPMGRVFFLLQEAGTLTGQLKKLCETGELYLVWFRSEFRIGLDDCTFSSITGGY